VRTKLRPGLQNGPPANRIPAEGVETHGGGQKNRTSRLLAQDVLKSEGPESVTSEKGADLLSLQSRCLGHRREEVETTRLAGTTTNVRGGGNTRVVVSDRSLAETSELIKLSR